MSRHIWFGVAFLLLPSVHLVADDAVANNQVASDENFEQLTDRFREIVIEAASDVDSPIRDWATEIARKRYADDRFDDVVRQTLNAAKSSEPMAIVWATKLMEGSSIEKPEQLTLLLDALIALEESLKVFPGTNRVKMTSAQSYVKKLLIEGLQRFRNNDLNSSGRHKHGSGSSQSTGDMLCELSSIMIRMRTTS